MLSSEQLLCTNSEVHLIFFKKIGWLAPADYLIDELCSAQVLTRAGVNADLLAGLDEEGNLDLSPGLQRGRLGGVGGGVAGKAGIRGSDFQIYKEGRLHIEDLAFVGVDGAFHILFDKLEVVAQNRTVNRLQLVGFRIHEVVKVTVGIAVFSGHTVDGGRLKFSGGVIGRLRYGSGNNILALGANESCTLARLDVLELDNLLDLAVFLVSYAVAEITCCDGTHISDLHKK